MTFSDLKLRMRALLRPGRVAQELDEELAFHLEREAGRLVEDGMAPAEARGSGRAPRRSIACRRCSWE